MRKGQRLDLTVWGERHHVVMVKPRWWACLHGGRLRIHLGALLHGGQPQARWLEQPKPCSRCKQPSWTATPRGRAVHLTCEGWLDALPDDLCAQVSFGVAVDLGAVITETVTYNPKEVHRDRHAA